MGYGIYVWGMIGILICAAGVANRIAYGTKEVETTCYDRYSRRIDNMTCYKEIPKEGGELIEYILMGLFLFNLVGTPIILIKIQDFMNKREAKKHEEMHI